jgi:hypothetical protein
MVVRVGGDNEGRNVGRQIAIVIAFATLFAVVLGTYLVRATRVPPGPVLVGESDGAARAPDDLDVANTVGGALVDHVRAGRFEAAYALMAAPYRERADVGAFRRAWTSSPLLRGLRGVRLTSARAESVRMPDGRLAAPATFTARGALVVAAGALEASFTFLREAGETRVLVLSVGGVPLLNGVN